ncbi:MAG: insulinase family protein, partial [Spirochaetales bacterium]
MKQIARVGRGAFWIVVALALISISCVGSPANRPASVTLPDISNYSFSDPLPLAPELVKRILPNGLTYYVRANGNPGRRVIMYLTVAGGSSVENDDELGYAHFIEHMAFNGTASYPENELVRYLRSIGMEFGAEVNAYTAIEETVYTLEMPTDNPVHFETGLKVLREWASAITLDPVEVEKEKGVILEERRLGLGS